MAGISNERLALLEERSKELTRARRRIHNLKDLAYELGQRSGGMSDANIESKIREAFRR